MAPRPPDCQHFHAAGRSIAGRGGNVNYFSWLTRRTTISLDSGSRNRRWRKITWNTPGKALLISRSSSLLVMT